MAKIAKLRLWEDNPENDISKDIIIETKLNDFGNPLTHKSILGFFANSTQGSLNHTYGWTVFYRISTEHPYNYLTAFGNVVTSDSVAPGDALPV